MNGSITSVNGDSNLILSTSTSTSTPPPLFPGENDACECAFMHAKCVTASSSRAAGVAGIDAKQVSGTLQERVTSAA